MFACLLTGIDRAFHADRRHASSSPACYTWFRRLQTSGHPVNSIPGLMKVDLPETIPCRRQNHGEDFSSRHQSELQVTPAPLYRRKYRFDHIPLCADGLQSYTESYDNIRNSRIFSLDLRAIHSNAPPRRQVGLLHDLAQTSSSPQKVSSRSPPPSDISYRDEP